MPETIQRRCTAIHHARIISCLGLAKHAVTQFLRRISFNHKIDRDEAESVALYALTRAAMAYDPDRGFAFSTYALRTMQRALWKSLRKNCRFDTVPMAEEAAISVSDNQPGPDEHADTKEQIHLLRTAVDSLPDRWQQVLHMHYGEDLSFARAGKRLGLSRQRAAMIVKDAKEKLHRRLRAAA